jgi:hypothetical protein
MDNPREMEALQRDLEQLARSVITERIVCPTVACGEPAALQVLIEIGRRMRRQAASRFAEGARSFGDGMDMFDNTDRSHRADFARWWDDEIGDRANAWNLATLTPVDAQASLEQDSSSFTKSVLAAGAVVTETALVEAAMAFGARQWALEATAAAQAAHESANARCHGSQLLHEMADRWSERAISWRAATDVSDQSPF